MTSTYIGIVQRNLESGRPVFFGDVLDSLTPEDEQNLAPFLAASPVSPPSPSASASTKTEEVA